MTQGLIEPLRTPWAARRSGAGKGKGVEKGGKGRDGVREGREEENKERVIE